MNPGSSESVNINRGLALWHRVCKRSLLFVVGNRGSEIKGNIHCHSRTQRKEPIAKSLYFVLFCFAFFPKVDSYSPSTEKLPSLRFQVGPTRLQCLIKNNVIFSPSQIDSHLCVKPSPPTRDSVSERQVTP